MINSVPPELVIRHLERIVSSPIFKNSNRLSQFLRYVVEESLVGNTDALKEQRLGIEVFDRSRGYDTRMDPVVRVEARQLRFKLAEYYIKYGSGDEIVVTLPKGGYAARFERKLAAIAEGSDAAESSRLASRLSSASQSDLSSDVAGQLVPKLADPGAVPVKTTPSSHLPLPRVTTLLAVIAGLAIFGVAYLLARKPVVRWIRVTPQAGNPTAVTYGGTHSPANPEAEDLYLKGRYYWGKRTPDDLTKAVDYFTQAIVRDPGYVQAYAGLADSYNLLCEYSSIPASEAYPRALAAAKQAVKLDETSAEAHASLAFASFWGMWDIATAKREFNRALEIDPNYAAAHHWYATFLMALGSFSEALREIERARQLDPMSTSVLADKGLILFYAGRHEEAIALLKQIEATEPMFVSTHRYLSHIFLDEDDELGYLEEYRAAAELSHDTQALEIVETGQEGLGRGGRKAMLENILRLEEKFYAQGRVSAYNLAETSSLLGRKQIALEYLRTAYAKHESSMLALRIDPKLRSLQNEPSYKELLTRIGLVPLA